MAETRSIDDLNKDHHWVLEQLKRSQDADHDNRERAREAHLFVDKRDGQWEATWYEANDKKPRYTFDKTNPILNQICNELFDAEFAIVVDPAGGSSTTKDAQTYEGIVRHIENVSGAKAKVYHQAARNMVTSGIDGWRVVQKYVDDDSFDQDLAIEKVSNYVDRVWFDANSEQPDHSDSDRAWVMQAISPQEYKRRWPNGSEEGVTSDNESQGFWHQPDHIIVGEYYYYKEVRRTLVLFSNGEVYEDDERLQAVTDELSAMGITEVRRRERVKRVVCMRTFDNRGWLDEPRETVFNMIPVVPVYGNYKIYENKLIYWGAVEKIMDAQRVLNYSLSREVEEGALAPRAKYWMTEEQAEGYESTLQSLNTNTDPVQFFNPDPELPGPPVQIGGAQINPGLRNISEAMNEIINHTSGMFAANMGDNPNAQSGVAIRRLQDKGDTGTYGYTVAMEIALARTFNILIGAIPEVYQDERQVRIMNEDGTTEVITLNTKVIDQQTGQTVHLNDLRTGKYNVTCRAGAAFKNRQEQTVEAITSIGQIDPSAIEMGGDVLFKNIPAPGMDLLAERKRQQLFNAGMIPFEQLTDDEKQTLQQAQMAQQGQEQPPDPMMVAAQAELIKAQDQAAQGEHDRQKDMIDLQMKQQTGMTDFQLKANKEQRADAEFQYKVQNNQFAQGLEVQRLQMEQNKAIIDALHSHAQTLNEIREAMGADAIMSEQGVNAYQEQAENVENIVEAIPGR